MHSFKIHIIGTHLLDAIKQTGETFHNESDEVVEQAHYRVNAFERSHGYLVIAFLCYVFMCPFKQLQIKKQNNIDCI